MEARQTARYLANPFLAVELAVAEAVGVMSGSYSGNAVPPAIIAVPKKVVVAPIAVVSNKEVVAEASASVIAKKVEEAPVEQLFEAPVQNVEKVEAVVEEKVIEVSAVSSEEPIVPLELLVKKWVEFVNRANAEQPSLAFMLGVAKPVAIVGNVVQIGFPFAFHRDKCNEDKNRRPLETFLTVVLGKTVRVEGILLEKTEEVVHNQDAFAPNTGSGSAMVDTLTNAFGGKAV